MATTISNPTPFAAAVAPAQDRDGRDLAVAVLKATFRFRASGEVSPAPKEAQVPVFLADVFHGDPAATGLRCAADVSPPKPGTDVAIVGHAYGRGRKEIDAGFRVGALEKVVVVSGPRVWVGGFPVTIAGPVPFEKVALRWEHAFGGAYEEPGKGRVAWPGNPVGVGFAKAVVDRAPLPSIEHRSARYRSTKDRPPCAGLGFVPPGFTERARFAGTFDAAWEKARRPLFPVDQDERFWNAVPQDQVLRPKLRGGERLVLLNVHPEAETVTLVLPRLALAAAFRVKDDAPVALPMTADALVVEPDEGRLALTYRAILPVGDDLRHLRRVAFKDVAAGAAAPAPAPRPR